jgi:hypothetical protein
MPRREASAADAVYCGSTSVEDRHEHTEAHQAKADPRPGRREGPNRSVLNRRADRQCVWWRAKPCRILWTRTGTKPSIDSNRHKSRLYRLGPVSAIAYSPECDRIGRLGVCETSSAGVWASVENTTSRTIIRAAISPMPCVRGWNKMNTACFVSRGARIRRRNADSHSVCRNQLWNDVDQKQPVPTDKAGGVMEAAMSARV